MNFGGFQNSWKISIHEGEEKIKVLSQGTCEFPNFRDESPNIALFKSVNVFNLLSSQIKLLQKQEEWKEANHQ